MNLPLKPQTPQAEKSATRADLAAAHREFLNDDAFQKWKRDTVLAPAFYQKYTVDGRYVFIDKGRLKTLLQQRLAVDTIVQGTDGAAVAIEEKIVRKPHANFFLETMSCTRPGRERDGWMRYGQADYLVYAFTQPDESLDVWLIDFPALQAWFTPRENLFHKHYMRNRVNRSLGHLVPIWQVVHPETPVQASRYHARTDGTCERTG